APKPAPGPAAAAGGGGTMEVTIPDIGDYHDIPVIEVLVKDGDTVDKDAPLIVLESEKATMEVPAPAAGTVRGMKVKVGSKVSKDSPIATLELASSVTSPPSGGEVARSAPLTPALPQSGEREKSAPPWLGQAGAPVPHASPYVRKLAREFGVDLSKVQGSGPRGRILAEDVQGYTKKALAGAAPVAAGATGIPAMPAVDFSQWGAIETRPLARIRKLSAQYLHRAWLNVPHVTQNDEADITELEAFRKAQSEELSGKEGGVKLTLLPFIMKAVSVVMKQYPEFNASLAPDGENLVLKKYCNIGFAADTEHGLVVPVVKDIWNKGIVQLAQDCAELAKKARDGKLKPDEMKGGCFSISSLGGIGGSHFTPIVNAPEVAILGVSRAQMKPVWDGKQFAPRLMCPLSLSYDHRVIDGAYAARFIVALSKALADLRRTLL
ncbi:MAG: dihydrolipoyllysine-residue acetyltransferase, partial [Nevskiaceae bacterium]